MKMPANGKVVINLSTGLEDPDRVIVAFLVGGAAAQRGKQVAMFLTKEAVGLALTGWHATAARRWRGSSSSTRRAAASCSPARSACTPAGSTTPA
jgi:hypothetical protein